MNYEFYRWNNKFKIGAIWFGAFNYYVKQILKIDGAGNRHNFKMCQVKCHFLPEQSSSETHVLN